MPLIYRVRQGALLFCALLLVQLALAVLRKDERPTDSFPRAASKVAPNDQIDAVRGLLTRLGLSSQVLASIDLTMIQPDPSGHDIFTLATSNGRLIVRGNSGVALASGFYWYLKYYCFSDVSWGWNGTGDSINVPYPLPAISIPVRKVSPVRYRYYMNVCTVSYSTAFWNWARWEREIDWMALQGYNLPLSFTGQEFVWEKVFLDLGLTQVEIDAWFSGPAFLAWNRMGNIQAWAGPLTADWREKQATLQKLIIARQRAFGMTPVLPAFAGHVPAGFRRLFPSANFTIANWGAGFSPKYGAVNTLQPAGNEELYDQIQAAFLNAQTEIFGTDHFYNGDTWNEMECASPPSNNPSYLQSTSQIVYNSMAKADPQAVWVLQGWTFINSPRFWLPPQTKAYLDGIPTSNLLILDLYADGKPGWSVFSNWFGKPFIWCMLHNFGGQRSLYGNLPQIASVPVSTEQTAPNMIGTGITMEAIEQNPVIYQLMSEMGWNSNAVDAAQWVSAYVTRRYASKSPSAQTAWDYLLQSVYNSLAFTKGLFELPPQPKWSLPLPSNPVTVLNAWRQMNAAAANNEVDGNGPFRYDLVDIGRQVLGNLFYDVYKLLDYEFFNWIANGQGDLKAVTAIGATLLDLLSDLDSLLASDVNFLLGVWTEAATDYGASDEARKVLLFNAKNQITLWGPIGNVNDYAAKHWAGLVGDYYRGRWSIYVKTVIASIKSGAWNDTKLQDDELTFSQQWGKAPTQYSATPVGDSISISQAMLAKYGNSNSTYVAMANSDSPGNDLVQTWTTDLSQLKFLCDASPNCAGFNSNGFLKTSIDGSVPSSGTTLYTKGKPSRSA